MINAAQDDRSYAARDYKRLQDLLAIEGVLAVNLHPRLVLALDSQKHC